MDDDGVAHLDTLDSVPHLLDPARILVTQDVRELDGNLALPDALDDVQVGAAEAGTPDTHDDVVVAPELRLVHGVNLERLLVRVEPSCLHEITSNAVSILLPARRRPYRVSWSPWHRAV